MARTIQVIFSLCLLFLFPFARGELHCYMPDGSIADSGTVPCNATATVSACCDPRDSCTLSGYCLGQSGYSYRSACTDSTWMSSVCPSLCRIDPISQLQYDGHTDIYPCGPGTFGPKFCCGHMANTSVSCCGTNFTYPGTGNAFKPGTDLLLAQLANATANATATHPAATVTVTAVANVTSANATSNGSSKLGVALGAGIGVPLGLLSLGILGFLFWREKKKDRSHSAIGHTETKPPLAPTQIHNAPWPPPPPKDDMWKPQNEYARVAAHEVYAGPNIYETGMGERHELRG